MFKIAAALTLLSTALAVQAGTSAWRNNDPGSYTDADTQLTAWNLSGVPWKDFKYRGPLNHCPGRPNTTACTATHSTAVSFLWSLATGVKVAAKVGFKWAEVTAELSEVFTTGKTFTETDLFSFAVPPGQVYQFVSFIPRNWGAATYKGAMFDTGTTRKNRTNYDACLNAWGSKTVPPPPQAYCAENYPIITQYYYEWRPDQDVGNISGNKNTKNAPIWTWVKV
jgi:hypothetical protein